MYNRRFTPEKITQLAENEIFVFGSNLAGRHGGGAARTALEHFGAVWGNGTGLQGQSYAIPTMHGGTDAIRPYVDQFIQFAAAHREYTFLVTRVGCGIAAFSPAEIAPLFAKAIDIDNIILPKDFVDVIQNTIGTQDTASWTADARAAFMKQYESLIQEVRGGNQRIYYKVKELRAEIFQNTVALVNQGYYISENGRKFVFDNDRMLHGTKFYSQQFNVHDIPTIDGRTTIEVVNADCMHEGFRLLDKGYNPAVLNMASRRNPGGGVYTGAGAQEETIFRRTNIFRSMYQFAPFAGEYGIRQSAQQYPLDRNFGGVYTPSVTVFREEESNGFRLMEEPRELGFISVAGMNRPQLRTDGMIADHLVEPIRHKIRTILRIGLIHGHDSLVLGALGCGAFRNPPAHIARLFHEVILENEFADKYRHISFAILEDHNSHRQHNQEGNYLPFKNEFENSNEKN